MPASRPNRLRPEVAIGSGALLLVVTVALVFGALIALLQGHMVAAMLLWALSAVGILGMAFVFLLASPGDRSE